MDLAIKKAPLVHRPPGGPAFVEDYELRGRDLEDILEDFFIFA